MFSFRTKLSMLKAVLTKNSPFYVQFYVSKFCHQKCQMCNIVESNADLTSFDIEKIDKIADNLVKIGVGVVLLTGGEPLLRSDLDKIVLAFKTRGLDVRMQTAGLFARKELIKKCVDNGARDINISLDSLDEKLSDEINGLKGSWKNAIRTISYVSKIFPKKDSICAFGCVLSPYNIDEIEHVLKFATKIGWWLSLVPVHVNKKVNILRFRSINKSIQFDEKSIKKVGKLIKKLKAMKKKGYLLFDSDAYLDSVKYFVENNKANWRKNNVCDSANLYFAILPDASFAPCCDYRFSEKVYLYDDNFPQIYRSLKFKKDVNKITSQCEGCNYGSYPEMTLTVRSAKTFFERIILQLKVKNVEKKEISVKGLLTLIKQIKSKNKKYYRNIKSLK